MTLGISLPQAIAAVAGLGTASYGLVDATKVLNGGLSNAGFGRIRSVMTFLFPKDASANDHKTPLALGSVLDTLKANWINGTTLNDQKLIARSLIKLRLSADTAGSLAEKIGVDSAVLTSSASKIAAGTALTQQEADVLGRFDLILTTALDEGYQRADQRYRNACKGMAVVFSTLLALVGGWTLHSSYTKAEFIQALIVGLLATPLAPVAKDLSTAVQTASRAVKIFQG